MSWICCNSELLTNKKLDDNFQFQLSHYTLPVTATCSVKDNQRHSRRTSTELLGLVIDFILFGWITVCKTVDIKPTRYFSFSVVNPHFQFYASLAK